MLLKMCKALFLVRHVPSLRGVWQNRHYLSVSVLRASLETCFAIAERALEKKQKNKGSILSLCVILNPSYVAFHVTNSLLHLYNLVIYYYI